MNHLMSLAVLGCLVSGCGGQTDDELFETETGEAPLSATRTRKLDSRVEYTCFRDAVPSGYTGVEASLYRTVGAAVKRHRGMGGSMDPIMVATDCTSKDRSDIEVSFIPGLGEFDGFNIRQLNADSTWLRKYLIVVNTPQVELELKGINRSPNRPAGSPEVTLTEYLQYQTCHHVGEALGLEEYFDRRGSNDSCMNDVRDLAQWRWETIRRHLDGGPARLAPAELDLIYFADRGSSARNHEQ